MLEMKLVVRAALRRYTIEPARAFERTRRRAITISPRDGARTVLLPRPKAASSANGNSRSRQATESAPA